VRPSGCYERQKVFHLAAIQVVFVGMLSLPFMVLKSTMVSKTDKIRQQMAQLAEQLKQAKAAEEQQKRKDDTRRKILVGSIVLELVEQGKLLKQDTLNKVLDEYLKRDNDRRLFNLQPLPKPVEHLDDSGATGSSQPVGNPERPSPLATLKSTPPVKKIDSVQRSIPLQEHSQVTEQKRDA
jgi:hypothetical protein